METKVYANGRGIAAEDSGGQSIVSPDACKKPSPDGPAPLRYPNVAMSSDADKGPKSVHVNGKMPMVKGAHHRGADDVNRCIRAIRQLRMRHRYCRGGLRPRSAQHRHQLAALGQQFALLGPQLLEVLRVTLRRLP
ncbi:PAAR-like domain-containing protein [Myxococcus xanthus]|uniref:PAAR-like domain-containing protein n=1 Tax=Myxococcus xanthus TaxID=34 RepID=UPI00112C24F4|nr:PAAR-like domain-containing protein [Myxococcus xanthus]